jgi:hypothetical protein
VELILFLFSQYFRFASQGRASTSWTTAPHTTWMLSTGKQVFLIESKTLMIFYYIFWGAKDESDLTFFKLKYFKNDWNFLWASLLLDHNCLSHLITYKIVNLDFKIIKWEYLLVILLSVMSLFGWANFIKTILNLISDR